MHARLLRQEYRHTLRIFNNYCFSVAMVVTWMCLNAMLNIHCLVLFCICKLMGLRNAVSLYSSAALVNERDSQALLHPLVLCTCEFLIDLSSTTSILCLCFTRTWLVVKHCFILYDCCCYTSVMGKHCIILYSFCT